MSIFTASFVIGVLALDSTIALQMLLSQPIFGCSILGMVLGDPLLGVEIGMIMQLLWVNVMPVGASTFPEGGVGSMVTCAIVIISPIVGSENLVFAYAFVAGISVSALASQITVLDRKLNNSILDMTLEAAEKLNFRRILVLDIMGGLFYAGLIAVLVAIVLSISQWLLPQLQAQLPAETEMILRFVKPAVWAMGIGLTAHLIWNTYKNRV
ncbi:MAG: PTS sugar transporter subunit IIC [Calditrichia bacterium]